MSTGRGGPVGTRDARLEAALEEIFAETPGPPAPEFDVEDLLRRAKGSLGLPDPDPALVGLPSVGLVRRRSVFTIVGSLILVVLMITGALAWQRAEAFSDDAARQQAIALATRPVHAPFTRTEVERLAAAVTPGIVDVETELGLSYGGAGTGIVLSPGGEVLTNNHVINGAHSVEVVTKSDGRRYAASVVGYDRNHDVALLQIRDPGPLTPAAVGDSSTVRVGDPILGLGNAGGAGGRPARAPGTIAELGAWISTSDELTGSTERLRGLIRVLADIRPGDSGGPLVNEVGQVIAVNTAASVNYTTNVPNGIGYAIPINDALGIVAAIRAGQSTDEVHVGPTAILGVTVSGPELYPDGRIAPWAKPGAVVTGINSDSPAEGTGLRRGDTIVAFGGTTIDTPTRLTAVTGMHRPGDRLNLDWIDAGGQAHTAQVTLTGGPPA
ncbi:MAG TPA: trypsin-like peptidase domain-containing protein [Pseudonocardia sp.]|nr:trypsin-like peptidase domain-containing protein [Pseudonocardia sp.]